ncbi:MAG: hypothetical protein CVU51_16145 [Deltaproteobacteria bacterium HGW-Deltaproteobacteria-1]|nr:MAG: hypothetical protein CVU51_16145 [Deltaproteobacteria bacterium HGW-Deltaproteobacteria-1]
MNVFFNTLYSSSFHAPPEINPAAIRCIIMQELSKNINYNFFDFKDKKNVYDGSDTVYDFCLIV